MQEYDIILVSGEYYADHPLSGVGVLVKILQDKGFSVAVIEKPDWKKDNDFLKRSEIQKGISGVTNNFSVPIGHEFLAFGKPKLFFGVTSGSIDSMLLNYTPLKKKRSEDKYNPYNSGIPDRAVTVYCNKIKQLFKDSIIVIGGIEASMRRFTHYDYWENRLRKSILLDSRANILVYGSGEFQIIEIANRIKNSKSLDNIDGTCILSNKIPHSFKLLPSYDEVLKDKKTFCKMQLMLSTKENLAQKTGDKYVLQYKLHNYTTKELDYIYDLDYSRDIPKKFPEFKMAQFSVVTHRGCIGDCNFCSITLHTGNRIVSRSEESILNEIKKITKHKDFKGYIDDLGGASANMYGMDCLKCDSGRCIGCKNLDKSHSKLIHLLRAARKIIGIKKIFIRSGIRYDLAVESEEYIKEIADYHTSGCLKIAPEHNSEKILKLMNKEDNKSFEKFKKIFEKHNKPLKQYLNYYFMTGHPGSTIEDAQELAIYLKRLGNVESVQLFTPTPMTISTCMYYTGLDPYTLKKVHVPYTYNEKKMQKRVLGISTT